MSLTAPQHIGHLFVTVAWSGPERRTGVRTLVILNILTTIGGELFSLEHLCEYESHCPT